MQKKNDTQDEHQIRSRVGASLIQRRGGGLAMSLYQRVPLQKELNRLLNQYTETGDDADLRRLLRRRINDVRRRFRTTNGDGHSHPKWLLPTIHGIIAHTFGEYETAIDHHREALQLAGEEYQRAISFGNISDTLRNLGRYNEAVDAALKAVEIDPRNDGFWAYLAMALYRSGLIDELRDLLQSLALDKRLVEPGSVWRQYLLSYGEFREMDVDGILEIRRLFQRLEE